MASLWQNLHNFYVRKLPSLDISNNFTNQNQTQTQNDKIKGINGINGIDKTQLKNSQNLEKNLEKNLENQDLQTQNH